MSSCRLFVYGLLQPGFHSPETMRAHWPDRVAGRLYDLGPYPGAVDIGNGPHQFAGSVVEIDDEELLRLDEFEGVTGDGHFRRIRVTTVGGSEVWIYEYTGPVPDADPIERWPARD